jgi:hypothetical protein
VPACRPSQRNPVALPSQYTLVGVPGRLSGSYGQRATRRLTIWLEGLNVAHDIIYHALLRPRQSVWGSDWGPGIPILYPASSLSYARIAARMLARTMDDLGSCLERGPVRLSGDQLSSTCHTGELAGAWSTRETSRIY